MIGKDHLDIIKKGTVQEYSLLVHRTFNVPASEKTSIQTKNFLFER